MKLDNRTLKIAIIICIIFLMFSLFFGEDINFYLNKILSNQIVELTNISLAFFFISAISLITATYIFKYLNKDIERTNLEKLDHSLKLEIISMVQTELYNNKLTNEINDVEKKQLIQEVKNKIENQASESYFNQLKSKIKTEVLIDNFENELNRTLNRLESERSSLARRGNLNLVIGMMLSLIGLFILSTSIFISTQQFTGISSTVSLSTKPYGDLSQLLFHMLPKTVLTIFIEIFAYFFLRLYKQSLDDIKFYQNELTNIEAKYLSLVIAKQSNNHKLISMILEELVKTERNFILEKGQSTIELEKEKISSTSSNNTLKVLTDLLKSKNS